MAYRRSRRRLGAIETSSLPDGWYKAHIDDGIMAGPFETKRDAVMYLGQDAPLRRYGPGLYEGTRGWHIVHIQNGIVPGGFEVLRDDFDPADFMDYFKRR